MNHQTLWNNSDNNTGTPLIKTVSLKLKNLFSDCENEEVTIFGKKITFFSLFLNANQLINVQCTGQNEPNHCFFFNFQKLKNCEKSQKKGTFGFVNPRFTSLY